MTSPSTAQPQTFGGEGRYAIRARVTRNDAAPKVVGTLAKPTHVAGEVHDFTVSISDAARTTATIGCFTKIIEVMGWNVDRILAVADESGNTHYL